MSVPYFPKLFADAVLAEVSEKNRRPSGFAGASSVKPKENMCLRAIQFALLKTDRNNTAPSLSLAFTLFRGTVLDEVVKKLSQRLGLPMEPDIWTKDEVLKLLGPVDFLLRLAAEDGGLTVLELKSIDPDAYRYMRGPLKNHVYQVTTYMMNCGAEQAILYYVPHMEEQTTDPVSLLKKAVRMSTGPMRDEIEKLVNQYGHLVAAKAEVKELGRQYLIKKDPEVVAEITAVMQEVQAANDRAEWLAKNMKNCALCPYTKPCFDEYEFARCDKRLEPKKEDAA